MRKVLSIKNINERNHRLKYNNENILKGRVNPTFAGAHLALNFKYEADRAFQSLFKN